MKRVFSAWHNKKDNDSICLIQGEGPPRFANGDIDEDCPVFYFRIEANSYEEAMAIYYLRNGWEPYKPHGAPAHCPSCGAIYYPEGSGQCWQCDDDL